MFSSKLEQESFGDQIYSSMCSMCETGDVEEGNEQEEASDSGEPQIQSDTIENKVEQSTEENSTEVASNDTAYEVPATALVLLQAGTHGAAQKIELEEDEQEAEYFAQLVGFGTAHAAQQFVQRLSRKEIPVMVRKRQSRTARGRFITWYQVVTEKYSDRAELDRLVQRLKKEEKLNDVQIVTC